MKIKRLIHGLEAIEVRGSKEIEVTGISTDSRFVSPGHLFIARRGSSFDANQFIPQAIESGASAVLTDCYNPFFAKITQLIHPQIETIKALLAVRFYRAPSEKLFVFGVTGTNGKTTTTYLVQHVLGQERCGLIGTVETIVGEKRSFSTLTTHDAIINHKLLREMVDGGCTAACLEASSHGLQQGRLDAVEFDVALFTNLTPDHLDYHGSMEHYFAAKKRLFDLLENSPKKKKCAIVNADDPHAFKLLEGYTGPRISFGLQPTADLWADSLVFSPQGTTCLIYYQGQSQLLYTPLIGRFNIYNVLGAIAVGLHCGMALEEISPLFASFQTVPGRLERVPAKSAMHVFVDYAHTKDALNNVLATLREIARGRIITVFGAGGNRDPGRRLGLAQAAERGSDVSIVTSDNPRQEDPQEIGRQILAGFVHPSHARVELDRKKAIELAIKLARSEDIVLVAGKGHECVQIFAHQTIPFDDRTVARAALEKL